MGLRSEATAVEVDATESGGRARTADGTAVPDGVLYRDDSISGHSTSEKRNALTIDSLFCVHTICSSRILARYSRERIRHMIYIRRCVHQKYPLEHHSQAAASFQLWQRGCSV